MGRTNIILDEDLVKKAMGLTGAKTKREVVQIALQRLVSKASLFHQIKELKGKLKWTGDLNRWRKSRL
jgi:Arc/MetJ family transcription regulator